jgi:C-terminal processing protease CtpA/Prc
LDALQVRDVIIQIGKQEIDDMDDYHDVVDKLKDRSDAILFRIKRGDQTHFEAVDPELMKKE